MCQYDEQEEIIDLTQNERECVHINIYHYHYNRHHHHHDYYDDDRRDSLLGLIFSYGRESEFNLIS